MRVCLFLNQFNVILFFFREKITAIRKNFVAYTAPPPTSRARTKKPTPKKLSPETQLYHAEEHLKREMERVHVFELKLGLESSRWTEATPEYQQAAILVSRWRYQRCLDELEALVVSRVFELTKMNMSQTGMAFSQAELSPIFVTHSPSTRL